MNKILCTILTMSWFFVSVTFANPPQSEGTMSEYFLHPNTSVMVKVVDADSHGRVKIEIHNTTNNALKLWDDASCWSCWKIIKISGGTIATYYQDQDRLITALSKPNIIEINPLGVTATTIDLNSSQWPTAAKSKVSFKTGDTVVAIYEVSYSPDSEKQHVWWGTAAGFIVVP